jgi:Ca2+-binding EF-hand superfamily protein
LSDDAKDILQKIFRVDPRHRATADQLLRHRWITKNTHNYYNLMTEEYISGIRRWKYSRELKNNLKNRFEACRKMKDKVIESLNSHGKKEQKAGSAAQTLISSDHFLQLKKEFLAAASKEDGDSIHFDAFKEVLLNCRLAFFATEEIFQLFDSDKSGTVDYCEFLLLLSSFRRDHAEKGPEHIKCLFEIFDRDGSKAISREEFSNILVHIIEEEDIDIHCLELFDKIDGDASGTITLEEFENFYTSIMATNSSLNVSSPMQSKKRSSPSKKEGGNSKGSSKKSKHV